MSEMEELVARAIAAAILAQTRSGATFYEQPELTIADDDSNSFWRLAPVARAAIAAITSQPQRTAPICIECDSTENVTMRPYGIMGALNVALCDKCADKRKSEPQWR